jgi:hypothetical protein
MSAVKIIRKLLIDWPPLAAAGVPDDRVHIGALPQGAPTPAIAISEVGGSEPWKTTTRRRAKTTMRSRVQVTVYAKTYEQQKALIKATGLGPGYQIGEVAGYTVNMVDPVGINPDIYPGDDKIYEQSRDFMVTFAEAN